MKQSTSILWGAGAIAALGLVLGVAVPKAAKAVTATLVQVVNTRATPVPNQDVDNAARHPFAAFCTTSGASDNFFCNPSPFIPSGEEAVITSVSMQMVPTTGNAVQASLFYQSAGVGGMQAYFPVANSSPFPTVYQTTQLYLDPGTSPQCYMLLDTNTSGTMKCAISGYTVSLP